MTNGQGQRYFDLARHRESTECPYRPEDFGDPVVFESQKSRALRRARRLMLVAGVLFLTGVEGKMFIPMAQTVSFAIMGALLLSLTYVPMMSALVLRAPKNDKKSYGDRFVHWVEDKYQPLLE